MQIDGIGLGGKIRARRQLFGFTQQQLAERIDVSTTFIGNVERGRRIPSLETLLSICYALELSPNELLSDSLPAHRFEHANRQKGLVLRGGGSVLRNTLSNWFLAEEPDDSYLPEEPADLSKLPPLQFGYLLPIYEEGEIDPADVFDDPEQWPDMLRGDGAAPDEAAAPSSEEMELVYDEEFPDDRAPEPMAEEPDGEELICEIPNISAQTRSMNTLFFSRRTQERFGFEDCPDRRVMKPA